MPILINGPVYPPLLHLHYNGTEHRKDFYYVNRLQLQSMKKKKVAMPKKSTTTEEIKTPPDRLTLDWFFALIPEAPSPSKLAPSPSSIEKLPQ